MKLEVLVHDALLQIMNIILRHEPNRPNEPAIKEAASIVIFQNAFFYLLKCRFDLDPVELNQSLKTFEGYGIFSTKELWPSTIYYLKLLEDCTDDLETILESFNESLQSSNTSYRVFGDLLEAVLELNPELKNGTFHNTKVSKTQRSDSGAHYTPETLTDELVRATVRPAFEQAWERSGTKDTYLKELRSLKGLDPAMGAGHLLTILAKEICSEIAYVTVTDSHRPFEWHEATWYPDSEQNVSRALTDCQKQAYDEVFKSEIVSVMSRSIHGLDLNWLAVQAGKLALWFLANEYEDQVPFDFLDNNLKQGDALLGLKWNEAEDILEKSLGLGQNSVTDFLGFMILEPEEGLVKSPFMYDLALLCSYYDVKYSSKGAEKLAKALSLKKDWYDARYLGWKDLARDPDLDIVRNISKMARSLPAKDFNHMVRHWDQEFPEVFNREASGFDIIVANPPFLGDKRLRGALGIDMVSFLSNRYSNGATPDLAGWFFLRYHDLVNEHGSVGSIGPNTISQGSNRTLVTRRIMFDEKWFSVYRVLPSRQWPGAATVHYCMVHFVRPNYMVNRKPLRVVENVE